MQIKRYIVDNMQQAMDAAIRELGSDAVMMNQKRVRKKGLKNLFRKPVLEVQFAYDPTQIPSVKKAKAAYAEQGVSSQSGFMHPEDKGWGHNKSRNAALNNEQIEQLNNRMDSFESTLTDFLDKFSYVKRDITYDYPEEVQNLLGKLIEAQVREELAHSFAKQTEKMLKEQPGTNATEIMEHLMLEHLGRAEPILHKKFSQKVILFLGPTGVGKTTTLIKLAADFYIKQKKSVGIINADMYRVGAKEQLELYGDMLGAPVEFIYYSHELEKAMENLSDREIIFVDTVGKSPDDEEHKKDLLEIVSILKPEDILLCISATTSFASMMEVIDTYGITDNYKLLITKIDETKYRGSILNLSWYSQKPLAYVTTGQNVPDDIEIADIEAITRQIIR